MAAIDVDDAVDRMTDFLRRRLEASGADGYVVGISGGIDSAVGVTLAAEAVGADAVTGLVLPGEPSDESNMDDARSLARSLGIEHLDVDITSIVAGFRRQAPFEVTTRAVGNLRARTRMVLLYLEANAHGHLVLGNTNKSELLLGYFTKYGDGAADLWPMADVYKTEVRAVARAVGVGETFLEKAPTAELWEGQTDEGELGASYETIDAVLETLVEDDGSVRDAAESAGVPVDEADRLRRMMDRSAHKRSPPPYPDVPRA